MSDHAVILDQADEETLIYDVPDEALEAAAATLPNTYTVWPNCWTGGDSVCG